MNHPNIPESDPTDLDAPRPRRRRHDDVPHPDISPEAQMNRETRVRALVAASVVLMLGVALVAIAAVGYLSLRAANASEENSMVLDRVTATNDRLIDCTQPGGECFEATQERTGAAVAVINEGTLDVIVAALSCQEDGVTEQRALARCTVDRAKAGQ